ncbi:type II toxin-antitoxin system RelE/ParE family toxin [Mesorhizobium sp. PUT5]|uniref:type II toxin-antitoxin system RelE/ParE family toxin n=1 Tax=Mesorhizobium sp. PUT5 TaxID=3454629 RepID=UPI003FA4ACCB
MVYRISPRAQQDLESIVGYIGERNPPAAVRLVDRFTSQWELLATQPRSGTEREDVLAGVRHAITGRYVSFYRVEDEDVLILRVLHGHRQITSRDFDE